jgi:hypothetical protein
MHFLLYATAVPGSQLPHRKQTFSATLQIQVLQKSVFQGYYNSNRYSNLFFNLCFHNPDEISCFTPTQCADLFRRTTAN